MKSKIFIRTAFTLSIIMGIFLLFSSSFAMEDEKERSGVSALSALKKSTEENKNHELAEKVIKQGYLVHIAPLNPFDKDLVMQQGSTLPIAAQTNTFTFAAHIPIPQSFRPCLSFSINSAIQDHGEISVSTRDYAVLIPFSNLASKIINLYPSDTAVWGPIDLKEQEDCIILTPQDKYEDNIKKVKSLGKVSAIPYRGNLTNVIDTLLKKKTGFTIQLQDAEKGLDIFYDKALLEKVDLNKPEIFEEFLRARPHVSFGPESASIKPGIMHWLRYLNRFNGDFLKLFKIDLYKVNSTPPIFLNKYKVDHHLTLAEHSLNGIETMLATAGLEEIQEDFNKNQKPKIQKAITNVKNYFEANKDKESYKKRHVDFSTIVTILPSSPYTWVQKLLDHSAFAETKEIFGALYWYQRYLHHYGYGHGKLDQSDDLEMLTASIQTLKKKFDTHGYNWNYLRFCNTIGALLTGIQLSENNSKHIQIALEVVMPLFPQSGKLFMETLDQTGAIDLKQALKERKIILPQNLWQKGLKNLSTFKSGNTMANSF